jgi:histidine triad (HIT) family protein
VKLSDCIFCRIGAGEIATNKVFEDADLIAFHDIRPQAPIHIQIIPKRHIGTIQDLKEDDMGLVGKMILTANQLAREKGLGERGYRLVFNCKGEGGQEVFHIHLHLLGGRKMGWPPG